MEKKFRITVEGKQYVVTVEDITDRRPEHLSGHGRGESERRATGDLRRPRRAAAPAPQHPVGAAGAGR
ncbi:MAG: hypothetical protein MZW92_41575 [Comamonadaceae bacterium]|nr:hypothetical protein [Comamonadaceae bacterium]